MVLLSGVRRLVHLRTEHLGPDDLLVVAKITVDPDAGTTATAALIDRAEAAVRASVPQARLNSWNRTSNRRRNRIGPGLPDLEAQRGPPDLEAEN